MGNADVGKERAAACARDRGVEILEAREENRESEVGPVIRGAPATEAEEEEEAWVLNGDLISVELSRRVRLGFDGKIGGEGGGSGGIVLIALEVQSGEGLSSSASSSEEQTEEEDDVWMTRS